ncbi:histidine phosphatase family protein [Clostridium sp. cel8]|jgi:phosphoserine phosphatase|uniref:histidine phosphatase family protein n=1 Tax=Clostridium sp. cel8 TaxID=2663123 RepID=UPI0015F66562|nr:histidine phosphatase family protein [Clostridium sp. cel8]MBA5851610.1 histidine phosphatase family protein [Clostridium sp. cel8]
METELLLIRHGQTSWNKLGKYQGSSDIELSEEGIIQAKYLKKHLKGKFDCIYTSPLKRAIKTAEIIASNSKKTPIIVNDLREINFGKWEGLTLKQIYSEYKDEYLKWQNDPGNASLPKGEISLEYACKRSKNALMNIVRKNKQKKIVVVAHGGILKAALVGLFNLDPLMYHKFILSNTSVTKILLNDNLDPIIYSINDTSHLPN